MQFKDIRAVYDFKTFVKRYRPKSADKGLQKHFSLDFERRVIRNEVYIFTRSKNAMSAKTTWSDWVQVYPSLLDQRSVRVHHPPSTVPPVMKNKPWDDFETRVVPTLLK